MASYFTRDGSDYDQNERDDDRDSPLNDPYESLPNNSACARDDYAFCGAYDHGYPRVPALVRCDHDVDVGDRCWPFVAVCSN